MQSEEIFSDLPGPWRTFLGISDLDKIAMRCSERLSTETSYPPRGQRFRAFELCAPDSCRVVIVGQDPYHGPDQATGLAFSVNQSMKPPPSLRNILQEWQVDLGISAIPTGDLTAWAQQGVLLINRVLTVLPGVAGSHRNLGWEYFTDLIIKRLSDDSVFRIFCLWGNDARQLTSLISADNGVIEAAHPSPLSAHRGFFGSKPFSSVNRLLREQGLSDLDWSLPLNLSGDGKGHTGQLF